MAEDLTSVDFFRDGRLTDDPYPFYEALRNKCPVSREDHYGVTMVTGWQEAVDVYNDAETFSSCISVTGPFPGFPVPLEGDDVTELIEKHRDEIPFSDQLPTLDPPTHTNHRALLMRLITPKRLKENEDAMWQLADDILDTYLAAGEGEFIKGFAGPFTLRVIADLLGVPEEDRDELIERLARGTHGGGLGNADKTLTKTPLEYLYEVFATYVEDRRREPRDDVLTGLATATFPDGSMPEVGDVVRVATNVFSAGQETTVRLLGTALKVIGDRPDIQRRLREDRSLLPNFIEECLRIESPVKGDFRLSRVPTTRRRGSSRRRLHADGDQRGRQPRSAPLRGSGHLRSRTQERPSAPRLRPRHPQLPRRTAGPRRNPGRARAAAGSHHRHQDFGERARPRR